MNSPYAMKITNDGSRYYTTNRNSGAYTSNAFDQNTGALSGFVGSSSLGFAWPTSIAFNSTGDRAWVAEAFFADSRRIFSCSRNTSSGALSGCSGVAVGGITSGPLFIETDNVNNHLFVSVGNNILVCPITNQATGTIGACVNTGATGLSDPEAFVFHNGFVYITNRTSSSISRCNYTPATGQFSSCINAQATGLNGPTGIAFVRK